MEDRALEYISGTWDLCTNKKDDDTRNTERSSSSLSSSSSRAYSASEKHVKDSSSRYADNYFKNSWSPSGLEKVPSNANCFQTQTTPGSSSSLDQDMGPRFSGMNLGDVMRITVLKEMDKLKMNDTKPLDLSNNLGKNL